MESFGLFDLLKSLLNFKGEQPVSPSSTPQSAQSSAPTAQDFSSQKSTGGAHNFPPPTDSPAPNAYVDFLNRHDELSKRRKKK